MTDQTRVMVDIETLGIATDSAILSLGAVTFDTDRIIDEFYREIRLQSCQEYNLEIDAGTLEWWLSQDSDVSHILTGGDSLETVLQQFSMWFPEGAEVWANAPSFDCETLEKTLETAYDRVGLEEPWEYYEERDVRTLTSLEIAPDMEMDGREHHALDDAKHQAREVIETLRRINNE